MRAAPIACLLASLGACGATLVRAGIFPEPRDVGAKEMAAARVGQAEGVLLEGADLFFPYDDLSVALVQPTREDKRVGIVRRFAGSPESPIVVVSAVSLTGNRSDGVLRYVRKIGLGTVDVQEFPQDVVVKILSDDEADLTAVGGLEAGKEIRGVRRIAPKRARYLADLLSPGAPLPGL